MYYGISEKGRYVAADRTKVDKLEQLALAHKVKPTYRRTCIARNNKRDKTKVEDCESLNNGVPQKGSIVFVRGTKKEDIIFADVIADQSQKVYTKLSELKMNKSS